VNGQEPENRRQKPCRTPVKGEERSTVDATVSIFGTEREIKASFEQEDGATRAGLARCTEVGAYNRAARHAFEYAE